MAQSSSPDTAVDYLFAMLGERYQCERLYAFEKNAQGNYDCTHEWVRSKADSKMHLLQNLSPKTVQQYYNYFENDGKLIVQNLEELAKNDYDLYQLLAGQNLHRFLTGQLVYDGEDRGFIGIDNPPAKYFQEMQALFDMITYFVSIQNARKKMEVRVSEADLSVKESPNNKKSMYERAMELEKDQPMGVICCSIISQGVLVDDQKEDGDRILIYAEQLFSNMFGQSNVFYLGNSEFVIIYEESRYKLLEQIDHFLEIAARTFERLNARLLRGVATTQAYDNDYFDLLNIAHAHMLHDKRKYKKLFAGNYQSSKQPFSYCDLVEIRSNSDRYRIIYCEFLNQIRPSGTVKEFIEQVADQMVAREKSGFLEFCDNMMKQRNQDKDRVGNLYNKTFHLASSSGGEVAINVVMFQYKDSNGESVLLCYTT